MFAFWNMHAQKQLQLTGTCNLSSYMITAENLANIMHTVTNNSTDLFILDI